MNSGYFGNSVTPRVLSPTRPVRFVFTPTHHWGARTPFDKCKALWGSWAVFGAEGNGRFWFGGDTAYCDVFAQIGEKLGPFDLAAIPIGNYRLFCEHIVFSLSLPPPFSLTVLGV